jgi:hypothetical protein
VLRQAGRSKRQTRGNVDTIGAVATGATLLVIVVSKFREGAWITVSVIPLLILLLRRVRCYHERLDGEVDAGGPLEAAVQSPPVIVIPMKRMDRVARKALRLAISLSSEVRAVQILAEEMKAGDLSGCWDRLVEEPVRTFGRKPPYLTVVRSPHRDFFAPLLGASAAGLMGGRNLEPAGGCGETNLRAVRPASVLLPCFPPTPRWARSRLSGRRAHVTG